MRWAKMRHRQASWLRAAFLAEVPRPSRNGTRGRATPRRNDGTTRERVVELARSEASGASPAATSPSCSPNGLLPEVPLGTLDTDWMPVVAGRGVLGRREAGPHELGHAGTTSTLAYRSCPGQIRIVNSYEARRLLVVVKTYPTPSQKYGETVCCGGVDLANGRWVRMYPITFRSLTDRRFSKYQVIECRAIKPRDDARPESLRIDQDSIRLIGKPIPAGPTGWARRMSLLPSPAQSVEEVKALQATTGTSIALVRPLRVERLVIEKARPWTDRQRAALAQEQLGLGPALSRRLRDLEQIPWDFSYRFVCANDLCTGHEMQIIDWEIGQSYRKWSREDPGRWEEMIRAKYEHDLPGRRDLHLVLGNLAKRQHTFVIIGLVYPPRVEVDGTYIQETLDLVREQRTVAEGGVRLETEQADALPVNEGKDALKLFPDEP